MRNNRLFSYHPEYGYPDEYRITILKFAEITSVREAAEVFSVSYQAIYKWRNNMKGQKNVNRDSLGMGVVER